MLSISNRTIFQVSLAGLLLSNGCFLSVEGLTFTAIPDQDESTLQARADAVSAYLESYIQATCGVDVNVTYSAVDDYQSAVTALVDGTADFGWYGGLTGVEAALRNPPAYYVAQRVEDKQFTSVFIQGPGLNLDEGSIQGANGKSLAFGSESSTSGHLMPAYFMSTADPELIPSSTIFTGSHDATVDAVANGQVQVGVLNSVVWYNRADENTTMGTSVFYTTPEYVDYLWVSGSDIQNSWLREFDGMTLPTQECSNINTLLEQAFLAAKDTEPLGEALLTSYSTTGFVAIDPNEYDPIEATGCELGLIDAQFCPSPVAPSASPSVSSIGDDDDDDGTSTGNRLEVKNLFLALLTLGVACFFA